MAYGFGRRVSHRRRIYLAVTIFVYFTGTVYSSLCVAYHLSYVLRRTDAFEAALLGFTTPWSEIGFAAFLLILVYFVVGFLQVVGCWKFFSTLLKRSRSRVFPSHVPGSQELSVVPSVESPSSPTPKAQLQVDIESPRDNISGSSQSGWRHLADLFGTVFGLLSPGGKYFMVVEFGRESFEIFLMIVGLFQAAGSGAAPSHLLAISLVLMANCFTTPLLMIYGSGADVMLVDTLFDITYGALLPLCFVVPSFISWILTSTVTFDHTAVTAGLVYGRYLSIASGFDLLLATFPLLSNSVLLYYVRRAMLQMAERHDSPGPPPPSVGSHLLRANPTFAWVFTRGLALLVILLGVSLFSLTATRIATQKCSADDPVYRHCLVQSYPLDDWGSECPCVTWVYIHPNATFHSAQQPDVYDHEAQRQQLQNFIPVLAAQASPYLRWIRCLGCGLTEAEVPEEIREMSSLLMLDLQYQEFKSVPPPICGMTNLVILGTGSRHITSLPTVAECPLLKTLPMLYFVAPGANLTIDESMCEMQGLVDIFFSEVNLRSLPECMGDMPGLKNMYFAHNRLESFPASMDHLHISTFYVAGNPLCENGYVATAPPTIAAALTGTSFEGHPQGCVPTCAPSCTPYMQESARCSPACNVASCGWPRSCQQDPS
eukprot:CAMPEP_0114553052 /NCGR_PEP_ID=MMETSP0114-20121206/7450_1 /TAXON_ID=31324 /ORGANISM="Goniomonas sp, Strain m" /LENGTH=656 /DNA_ID=CAMNT_0001737965 /DNA_START=8 /DNA_END=1978 /DNA_ORIENTATION=+